MLRHVTEVSSRIDANAQPIVTFKDVEFKCDSSPRKIMWPFEIFSKRTYKKRFYAAIVVYLGTYAYQRLPTPDQLKIEADIENHFNRTDTPAIAMRRILDADSISIFRAAAMERLGYSSPLNELQWTQLFEPWRFMQKVPYFTGLSPYDSRPDALLFDYRKLHQATNDAKIYLKSKGIELPQ